MPDRTPHRPHRAITAATIALAVTAGACTGSTDRSALTPTSEPITPSTTVSTTITPTTPPPTTPMASASTPPATTTEQEVIATYQAFIDTWFAANDPPNLNHPGIDKTVTGAAKELLLDEIAKNQRNGVVLRRPENSSTGITKEKTLIHGDSASSILCVVDDGQVLLAVNGAPLNSRTVTRKIEATFQRLDNRWRVERNVFLAEQDGKSSCDF